MIQGRGVIPHFFFFMHQPRFRRAGELATVDRTELERIANDDYEERIQG